MKVRRLKHRQQQHAQKMRLRWYLRRLGALLMPDKPLSVENFYSSEPMPGLTELHIAPQQ